MGRPDAAAHGLGLNPRTAGLGAEIRPRSADPYVVGMSLHLSDFRHAAAEATAAAADDPLGEDGPSACVPTGRGAGFRLMSVLLYACLAVALPAIAAFLFAPGFVTMVGGPPYLVAVLGLCFGPGLLLRVYVARSLGKRRRPPRALEDPRKPQRLFLSSPERFGNPGRSASDLGWLHADPEAGVAVFEGIVCRYVLHRRNVTSLREVRSWGIRGMEVECDVSGVTLVLVLSQPDDIGGIASRMIGMGGVTGWCDLLRDTLR